MSRMKNMIVLKEVKSNLIEEAIVVFKENVKIPQENYIKNSGLGAEEKLNNDLCIKEAELIIKDYILRVEKTSFIDELNRKCKYLKIMNIVLVIATVVAVLV